MKNVKKILLSSFCFLTVALQAADQGNFYIRSTTEKNVNISIPFYKQMTIAKVKEVIHDQKGFSMKYIWLIFAGKKLEDHKKLEDYNIDKDSEVFLVLKGPFQKFKNLPWGLKIFLIFVCVVASVLFAIALVRLLLKAKKKKPKKEIKKAETQEKDEPPTQKKNKKPYRGKKTP